MDHYYVQHGKVFSLVRINIFRSICPPKKLVFKRTTRSNFLVVLTQFLVVEETNFSVLVLKMSWYFKGIGNVMPW